MHIELNFFFTCLASLKMQVNAFIYWGFPPSRLQVLLFKKLLENYEFIWFNIWDILCLISIHKIWFAFHVMSAMLSQDHKTSLPKVPCSFFWRTKQKEKKMGLFWRWRLRQRGAFCHLCETSHSSIPRSEPKKKGWSQKLAVSAQQQRRRAVKEQRNWLISNAH